MLAIFIKLHWAIWAGYSSLECSETRILGRKTAEAMRTNRLTPDIEGRIAALNPNAEGYGFGLTVAVRERASALKASRGVLLEWRLRDALVGRSSGGPCGGFHGPGAGRTTTTLRPLINALVYQALKE